MDAFLILIWPPAAIAIGVSGVVTYLSFRARRYGARRLATVASVFLSFGAALCVLAAAGLADFNDYPGYTCAVRDEDVPAGFPPDRYHRHIRIS